MSRMERGSINVCLEGLRKAKPRESHGTVYKVENQGISI